jgi:hypothetical protein
MRPIGLDILNSTNSSDLSISPFELPVWSDIKWKPAQIKILIVSDGSSYSTSDGFSLGLALQDAFDPLQSDHPAYARFNFTKAHRTTTDGVTPGFENFQFKAGSLDGFDEIWLFGVTSGNPYLSPTEVATIETFMDAGGGVLAMGDHEDLGLGLCGGIKRIRSMRKWWFQSPPPPNGMLQAPDNTDLTRNDTTQPPLPGLENDAIPQPIYPNYRYTYPFWRLRQKYPHPLLCGPRGAITVLPDHPHEGDCIIPNPLFAKEYPGGVPVEIIAQGRNVVGREKGGYVITTPREFGLIGVWDGHNPGAKQGRVVVDATWHHWFNYNLVGLKAENGNEYKDILAYFRNVAIWLAPKPKQAAMRRSAQRVMLLIPSMVETMMTLNDFQPDRFYQIGLSARDALGKVAPQCQSAAWFSEICSPFLSKNMVKMAQADLAADARNQMEVAAIETFATTIFGGVVNAISIEINKRGLEKLDSWDKELDSIAETGGRFGIEAATKQLNNAQQNLKAMIS